MIPRIHYRKITAKAFTDDFFFAERPVVLEGGARLLRAYSMYTDDYLLDHLADTRVSVRRSGAGDIALIRFALYVDYMRYPDRYTPSRGGALYLDGLYLRPDHPELAADFDLIPLRSGPYESYKTLYFGPDGTGSPLHQDSFETPTWMGVLRGKKIWTVAPPSDPNAGVDVDVNAGDIIFVPALHWHKVKNIGATLAVSENLFTRMSVRDAYAKALVDHDAHWIGVLGRYFNESSCSSISRDFDSTSRGTTRRIERTAQIANPSDFALR
jgi:mannose-6-phosphate isomerase-like protein (cupin superfamily)